MTSSSYIHINAWQIIRREIQRKKKHIRRISQYGYTDNMIVYADIISPIIFININGRVTDDDADCVFFDDNDYINLASLL